MDVLARLPELMLTVLRFGFWSVAGKLSVVVARQ
jgi:hypothetical protein